MLRGLLPLTGLEIKIFLREPLGAIGTIVIPAVVFLLVGRAMGGRGILKRLRATPGASPVFAVGTAISARVLRWE